MSAAGTMETETEALTDAQGSFPVKRYQHWRLQGPSQTEPKPGAEQFIESPKKP